MPHYWLLSVLPEDLGHPLLPLLRSHQHDVINVVDQYTVLLKGENGQGPSATHYKVP